MTGPNDAVQDLRRYSSSPEQRLAGQVAVITGGASGIGAATARLFAEHGARVVIADIVEHSTGEKYAQELGPQALYVRCDVRREEDFRSLMETAYSLEKRLDVVHSNAGIIGAIGPIATLEIAEFDETLTVNLRSAVLAVKHAARFMIPANRGSIIITGSVAGSMGGLAPHAYSISKGALISVVKCTASELSRYGIRVNMISPEAVATPTMATVLQTATNRSISVQDLDAMLEQKTWLRGRHLTQLDVANAALFLASDMGGFISGHNLMVDAGFTTGKIGQSPNVATGSDAEADVPKSWFADKYMPMIRELGQGGVSK